MFNKKKLLKQQLKGEKPHMVVLIDAEKEFDNVK